VPILDLCISAIHAARITTVEARPFDVETAYVVAAAFLVHRFWICIPQALPTIVHLVSSQFDPFSYAHQARLI
jgi:hypothetical protein